MSNKNDMHYHQFNKYNFSNLGGKTVYQNQNNPDYYYEDPRSKIEQSNSNSQPVS